MVVFGCSLSSSLIHKTYPSSLLKLPSLLGLSHEQSSRLPKIADAHVKAVHFHVKAAPSHVTAFLSRALMHVARGEHLRLQLQKLINSPLRKILDDALEELGKTYDDEAMEPITYNHYFTYGVLKARQNSVNADLKERSIRQWTRESWGLYLPITPKIEIRFSSPFSRKSKSEWTLKYVCRHSTP